MSNKNAKKTHRLSFFATPDEYNQVQYFLSRHPHKWGSANEFLRAATSQYIAFINGDYKLPNLEQQRLNQLIDGFHSLSSTVGSLESVLISGFESLMHVTRGSNYLLDCSVNENGEL